MPAPKRGDVWQVNLNPTAGKEQQGSRPVLIVSQEAFNRSGLCVICPITQGGNQARFAGFAVSLTGTGCMTQGVVMANQPRTVDMAARGGRLVETIPDYIVDDVLAKLVTIFA